MCVCVSACVSVCVCGGLRVLRVVKNEDFSFSSPVSRFCFTLSSPKPCVNLRQLRLRPSITVKSHCEVIQALCFHSSGKSLQSWKS